MRKALLASAAFLLFCSAALAQGVSVIGDARFGVKFDNSKDTSVNFHHEFDIIFRASGTTDSGIGFGGAMRIDDREPITGDKPEDLMLSGMVSVSGGTVMVDPAEVSATFDIVASSSTIIRTVMPRSVGTGETQITGAESMLRCYVFSNGVIVGEGAGSAVDAIAAAQGNSVFRPESVAVGDGIHTAEELNDAGVSLTVFDNDLIITTGSATGDQILVDYEAVPPSTGNTTTADAAGAHLSEDDKVLRYFDIPNVSGRTCTVGTTATGNVALVTGGLRAVNAATEATGMVDVESTTGNLMGATVDLSGVSVADSIPEGVIDNKASVFVSLDGNMLTIGDGLDAGDVAAGGLADIGFDDIGVDNVAESLRNGTAKDVRFDGSFGFASVAVTYGDDNGTGEWAAGFNASLAPAKFGVGFDSDGVLSVGAGASQGAISGNLFYSQDSDTNGKEDGSPRATAMGLELSYSMSDSTSVTLSYGSMKHDNMKRENAYGVGLSNNLGAGAVLKFAVGQVKGNTVGDLGIAMTF